MRLFQNLPVMPSYRSRLAVLTEGKTTFTEQMRVFLDDGFAAIHILAPVLDESDSAFFAVGNDPSLQRTWANENGMSGKSSLEEILLAQIESHRTEVFYNNDPIRFPSDFVKRLPGSVKYCIAWRAAPSGGTDFSAYDLMVCNFPTILDDYRKEGMRAAYFSPAHDPKMDPYASNCSRQIDVLFIGGYTRHHRNRAFVLEMVASLKDSANVVYHLDSSSLFLKIAESALGSVGPLYKYRRPKSIRDLAASPVFGRQLYSAISKSKIVLNGAIDMSGSDRGNMRCWEALGCGALLLSDKGVYPNGFSANNNMMVYESAAEAVDVIKSLLASPVKRAQVASAGYEMIRNFYPKGKQWTDFQALVFAT